MSLDKNSVDYMKQALSAINLVEEPKTYQEYLDQQTEDRASDSVSMAKLKQAVGGEEKLVSTLFSSAVQNNMDDPEFIDAAARMLNIPQQEVKAIINNEINSNNENLDIDSDMQAEDGHTDTDSMQAKTAQIAKDAMALNQMFKDRPGGESLDTWLTNKIAVAADKLTSVKNYLQNPTHDKPMEDDLEEKHGGEHTTTGRSMTKGEMDKREKIVKSMKSDKAGFKKRYGKDADAVMYATATKMAMKDDTQSIGESTMTDNNKKKLSEGISIQTDTLEDQIALMAILKNAGLDPQQMNIQNKPSMDAPAMDMKPDAPEMDEPEAEAYDNEPNEKFLDKDDYELKRNVVPNKDMGPSAASRGDNPLPEGRVKDMMMDMEADAAAMSKEEFIKAHGKSNAHIWDRVQGQMRGDPEYDESVEEAKHAKPDYLDFDKDGDKKEPMKKALKDKEKKKSEDAETDEHSLIKELNKQYELMVIGKLQEKLGLTPSARIIADENFYDGSRFIIAQCVDKGEGVIAEDGAYDSKLSPYTVAYHIVDDEIVGQVGAGDIPYLSRDGDGGWPVKHESNRLDLFADNFFVDHVSAIDNLKSIYEDMGAKLFGDPTQYFGTCEMMYNDK